MTDWGPEIAIVDGMRPDFVRDGDWLQWKDSNSLDWTSWDFGASSVRADRLWWAKNVGIIRLPADHPYYQTTQIDASEWTIKVDAIPAAPPPPPFDEHGTIEAVPQLDTYIAQIINYAQEARKPICDVNSWPHTREASAATQNLANALEAMTAALSLIAANQSPAKLIAQHESEPVDEATELWEEIREEYERTSPGLGGTRHHRAAAEVIRAHLAKVRAERGGN